MMVESTNQQPAVNVYPNGGNSGFGFGDGAFGGGFFWIIILFFFALFMGWGNGGNASGNNGGGYGFVPYGMPYGGVQQGFDQAAIMGGLNGIQTSLANAEVSRCNQQANILATLNGNQNANTAAMNSLAMGLQNCCCENRAATADLKYTVATEACADRAAIGDALQNVLVQNNANTQRILDMMCQDKIDAKNEKIAELQNQLTMANLAASQNAQTAAILTDNLAQTQALEQYLAPVARPAYIVQNPNCCANNFGCNSGCGCGR
jgi:hypothetical protein